MQCLPQKRSPLATYTTPWATGAAILLESPDSGHSREEFFNGVLQKTLDPVIALSTIAVINIFMFLLVGSWTVGGEERA